MKKFLSLMLVLALGCGTLSFAGCDGDLPTGETGENVTLTETEGQTPNPSEKSYYIELSENPILEGMESFEMEQVWQKCVCVGGGAVLCRLLPVS